VEFEERCKEAECARCREAIEDAIAWKRTFQYEDEVRKNPLNYDSWFDYIRLEAILAALYLSMVCLI